MNDYILTDCLTRSGVLRDIEIRDGEIDRILSPGGGDPSAFADDRQYDADGRLVTPSLTEPHVHLDSALTAGEPRHNQSNTLLEGIDIWEQARETFDKDDYKRRGKQVLNWFVSKGITRVRSHVFVGYESLPNLEALVELKEEYADLVDLQLVAYPSKPLGSTEQAPRRRFEEAIGMGIDLVGGYPDAEDGYLRGVTHIETVVQLADQYNLPLDVHVDETDDPESRFIEVLAAEAQERGIDEQTTASHATAMHSYPNAYADKLIRQLARSDISVVTNPLINSVVQGRYDTYPRRRGHTRVDELREAGVTVGIGQDDIVDSIYAYGDGDPLTAAFLLVHYAHMNGFQQVEDIWGMLIDANAQIFGSTEYRIAEGNPASLVVFDGRNPHDVLRRRAPRRLVLKEGKPVASTTPAESSIIRGDTEQKIDSTITID